MGITWAAGAAKFECGLWQRPANAQAAAPGTDFLRLWIRQGMCYCGREWSRVHVSRSAPYYGAARVGSIRVPQSVLVVPLPVCAGLQ